MAMLPSNLADPRFAESPAVTPTGDWRDDLSDAIEANGPFLPNFLSELVEALRHLWR
ncbi:MAG TPA: hypothetical protein VGL99_20725 [Chloroflexota bacterium]